MEHTVNRDQIRKQFEETLSKYIFPNIEPHVLDELMACLPALPRGVELEEIVWRQKKWSQGCSSHDAEIYGADLIAMINEIIAYATEAPPNPVWCEHIKRLGDDWHYLGGSGRVLRSEWTYCPICSARRPSGTFE